MEGQANQDHHRSKKDWGDQVGIRTYPIYWKKTMLSNSYRYRIRIQLLPQLSTKMVQAINITKCPCL